MKTGICYAVGATALWGLAFPLPLFVPQFSLLEIVLGRYLVYGMLSLIILIASTRKAERYHYSHIFKTGFVFAMSGSLIYYCLVLLGIRLAGAPVSALFVGVLPVTIPLYANWGRREFDSSVLILPISLIFAGLVLINADNVFLSHGLSLHTVPAKILGILSNIAALALWTWFGVANARFLKSHPEISSEEWSTIIGISTLLGATALGLILLFSAPDMFFWRWSAVRARDLFCFACIILILGLGVSWYATILWNRASTRLPITLLGQLIILETIFGLFYIFVKEIRFPTFFEVSGIVSALLGLFLCLKNISAEKYRDHGGSAGKP